MKNQYIDNFNKNNKDIQKFKNFEIPIFHDVQYMDFYLTKWNVDWSTTTSELSETYENYIYINLIKEKNRS